MLRPTARTALLWAASLGLTGTALGALASHALRTRLAASALASLETGIRYQQLSALLLVGLGLLAQAGPPAGRGLKAAVALAVAGTLLFSGSIYLFTLGPAGLSRGLWWLTPLGGALLLAAWAALGLWALRRR